MYDAKEFIQLSYRCGYCTKGIATDYTKRSGKGSFNYKDFINVYRLAEKTDRYYNHQRNVDQVYNGIFPGFDPEAEYIRQDKILKETS